jgi:hypothetical protein
MFLYQVAPFLIKIYNWNILKIHYVCVIFASWWWLNVRKQGHLYDWEALSAWSRQLRFQQTRAVVITAFYCNHMPDFDYGKSRHVIMANQWVWSSLLVVNPLHLNNEWISQWEGRFKFIVPISTLYASGSVGPTHFSFTLWWVQLYLGTAPDLNSFVKISYQYLKNRCQWTFR